MNVSRNCKLNMKYAIMNENVAFRLRFPISILLAIIVSVVLKDVKSINNRYIAHGFIPFVVFLLILFIIDISVRATISKDKLKNAELRCDALSLHPNKYMIETSGGGENVRLDNRFNNSVEISENFLDKQVNNSSNVGEDSINELNNTPNNVSGYTARDVSRDTSKYAPSNVSADGSADGSADVSNLPDYIRHNENKLTSNGLVNIVPNSEYSNEIPANDENSSSTDIDKYATLNTNVGNDNKNSYTQSIQEMCGSRGCCLLNKNCGAQCPGEPNNCNLVVPVPGPQLQVHRADVVQQRLQNGIYTSSKCPLSN